VNAAIRATKQTDWRCRHASREAVAIAACRVYIGVDVSAFTEILRHLRQAELCGNLGDDV
jgi:hypothetical protein